MLAVEVGFDLTVAKYKRSAKKQQINHYMAGVFYTRVYHQILEQPPMDMYCFKQSDNRERLNGDRTV